jgi:hypothetical protein
VAGTQLETARSDLHSLYQVGAPFQPGMLLKRRDATSEGRERLVYEAKLAAGFLVRSLADRKLYPEAQEALAELEHRVGEGGPLAAARVAVERGQNGTASTWPLAAAAVRAYPEDPDVLEQVALVIFDDGAAAPDEVVDAVVVRGRQSAKLNALLGLARAGRAADCLRRVDGVYVTASHVTELRAVTYRCAVGARDLERANRILAKGSTGLDARVMAEHAELWLAAGAAEPAWTLVEPLVLADSKAAEVGLRALAALGREAEMASLAASLPSNSVARLGAAVAAYNERRYELAWSLLPSDCAVYTGSNAALCQAARSGAARALGK